SGPRHALSHLIWSVPPLVSLDAALQTGQIWLYRRFGHRQLVPDQRKPAIGLARWRRSTATPAARPAKSWSPRRAVLPRASAHKMPLFGCRPHADTVASF